MIHKAEKERKRGTSFTEGVCVHCPAEKKYNRGSQYCSTCTGFEVVPGMPKEEVEKIAWICIPRKTGTFDCWNFHIALGNGDDWTHRRPINWTPGDESATPQATYRSNIGLL